MRDPRPLTGIPVTSRFSDAVVPHLSEKDARTLCHQVTERLRALGVLPSSIGVDLDREGFWFVATINGRTGSARTGQGHFTYEQVARELALACADPEWNRLTLLPPEPKAPPHGA